MLRSLLSLTFVLLNFLFQAGVSAEVTISNGSLGLQITVGTTNHVWADMPSSGQVFDRWTGDAELLSNPYAAHTTLLMPGTNASLAANFKPGPAWSPATNILNGLPPTDPSAIHLIYYFPTNSVGLIFFFNGAIGSAAGFFSEGESLTFARDAVAAGYAVASLDSGSGPGRSWDTTFSANNVDVVNVQKAINDFIAAGLMTTNTPRFATGMSAGGFFAPMPAYFLHFNACGIWCSSGAPKSTSTTVFNLTTVPTVWNLAQNDDLYNHTAFLGDASNNLALLDARGVVGEIRENPPSPVYPKRFTRIQGLTAADSQVIHDNLKSAGLLDDLDFLVSSPFNNGNQWQSAVSAYSVYFGEIQNQLNTCYSQHHFFSDFGNKTLQFFGAHRSAVARGLGISAIARQPSGLFQLTIKADPGQDYRVQASSNMRNWMSIFTNIYVGGTFDCIDTQAVGQPGRFYRTISP